MIENPKFSDLVRARERLMDYWEAALAVARQTGYWTDVESCAAVMDAFHQEIRDKLQSDCFVGDAAKALSTWDNLNAADVRFRRELEASVRIAAPTTNGAEWWAILGVAPNASDDVVRTVYLRRLQEHHPDRHSGCHPVLTEIATVLSARLNAAYAESRKRAAVTGNEQY